MRYELLLNVALDRENFNEVLRLFPIERIVTLRPEQDDDGLFQPSDWIEWVVLDNEQRMARIVAFEVLHWDYRTLTLMFQHNETVEWAKSLVSEIREGLIEIGALETERAKELVDA